MSMGEGSCVIERRTAHWLQLCMPGSMLSFPTTAQTQRPGSSNITAICQCHSGVYRGSAFPASLRVKHSPIDFQFGRAARIGNAWHVLFARASAWLADLRGFGGWGIGKCLMAQEATVKGLHYRACATKAWAAVIL